MGQRLVIQGQALAYVCHSYPDNRIFSRLVAGYSPKNIASYDSLSQQIRLSLSGSLDDIPQQRLALRRRAERRALENCVQRTSDEGKLRLRKIRIALLCEFALDRLIHPAILKRGSESGKCGPQKCVQNADDRKSPTQIAETIRLKR
jgi:hypothetical protein